MTTRQATKFGPSPEARPVALGELLRGDGPMGLVEHSMPTFGQPIGEDARRAGRQAVKAMWPASSKGVRRRLVDLVAGWLEKDEPHTAMLEASAVLDITGSYRLLATLAAGQA